MTDTQPCRYLHWSAVTLAVVLLAGTGWIWMTGPTELERAASCVKEGMSFGEVEAAVSPHGDTVFAFNSLGGYTYFWIAEGESVKATFNSQHRVSSVEYLPDPDRPSRLSRWWKRLTVQ